MPLDPSIIMGVKPPEIPDPMEFQNKSLTLQNLMQQREAGQLAIEQTRQKVRDEAAARQAFQGGGTESEIFNRLLAANPTAAMAYKKQMEESRGREAQTAQHTATAGKQKWEVEKEKAENGANLIGMANAQNWEGIIRHGTTAGYWSPEAGQQMMQAGYSPELVQRVQRSGITYAKQQELEGQAQGRAITMRGQDMTAATAKEGQGVTMRGQNMVDARAREAGQRESFGQPIEVTGPNGPQLVMQDRRSGNIIDVNTRQPVATNIGPKMGEASQNQQIGVQTTRDAIGEYRDALKEFKLADAANPNARARMGTIYNNMLLQAKEAYRLGVLNGPDYMILQQVITNPTTARGVFTSKEALDDQAAKLDSIMERVSSRITQTQTGMTPAKRASTPPPPKTFNSLPDPAQYRGRRIRSDDDGVTYESDGKTWKRQ